jgi:hypothetical protein
MNTSMMELNLNARELNLEEMEGINGGWKLKDLIVTTLSCGVIGATCGGVLGGLPGGVIGGAVGAGIGAGVCFM